MIQQSFVSPLPRTPPVEPGPVTALVSPGAGRLAASQQVTDENRASWRLPVRCVDNALHLLRQDRPHPE